MSQVERPVKRSFQSLVGDGGQAPPEVFSELCERIERHKAAMPRRIKQAAIFVLGHPDEVALQSVAKLAARAGTHPSVFVRLAQTMGYHGFSELQAVTRRRLLDPEGIGRPERTGDALGLFVIKARRSIDHLNVSASGPALRNASDVLLNAHTIFLIGQDQGHLASLHLAHILTASGLRNAVIGGGSGLPDQAVGFASAKDAAMVTDFLPSDARTAAQVRRLRNQGVPLVVVTDSRMHPLAEAGVAVVEVAGDPEVGLRGWGAFECIGLALASELRARRFGAGRGSHPCDGMPEP